MSAYATVAAGCGEWYSLFIEYVYYHWHSSVCVVWYIALTGQLILNIELTYMILLSQLRIVFNVKNKKLQILDINTT
jgi:hypothetical protein